MKTAPPRAGSTKNPQLPELVGATPFFLAAMAGDAAFEIAKGTGLLKQHQVMKGDTSTPNVFALKVEIINPMPTGQVWETIILNGWWKQAPTMLSKGL